MARLHRLNPVQIPRKIARRVVSVAAWAPIAISALVTIVLNSGAIRRADVVLMVCKGGFGHLITTPDLARRIFRGRRIVCIVHSFNEFHNWQVRHLFKDVRVVFVPAAFDRALPWVRIHVSRSARYHAYMSRVWFWLIRVLAPRQACVMTQNDFYQSMLAPDVPYAGTKDRPLGHNFRWPMAYAQSMFTDPMPPVLLPDRMRNRVRQALAQLIPPHEGGRPLRLCCLYLRRKNVATSRRNGPPVQEYVEGLRELNQAGYQVLLTGDADLTDEMFGAFGGMLVDARHARVDSEVFALYAATEADIWIGQAGGGIWLPGINGIPRLMIQAFPFGHGVANAWMHFKSVRDAHGVLVPYQKLFQDYAFEYAFLGMTVEDNSNSDIRDAIVSFLEDLDRQAKGLPVESPSFEFPPHTWAWYAKARISRAWLAKYAKAAASAGEPVRSGSEVAG